MLFCSCIAIYLVHLTYYKNKIENLTLPQNSKWTTHLYTSWFTQQADSNATRIEVANQRAHDLLKQTLLNNTNTSIILLLSSLLLPDCSSESLKTLKHASRFNISQYLLIFLSSTISCRLVITYSGPLTIRSAGASQQERFSIDLFHKNIWNFFGFSSACDLKFVLPEL